MKELQEMLMNRRDYLNNQLLNMKCLLNKAPEGNLRIVLARNKPQYYWRKHAKDICGTYICKNDKNIAKELAQKSYIEKIYPIIEEYIKLIDELVKYDIYNVRQIYDNMSEPRKKLVEPYILSDEEYIESWINNKVALKNNIARLLSNDNLNYLNDNNYKRRINDKEYGKCNDKEYGKCNEIEYEKVYEKAYEKAYEKEYINDNDDYHEAEIYTEKGERVRSKSEKILADKLYMRNIPYIYELPIKLEGYGYIKPDFTILNKRLRKTYYYEHFGMMDNKEYCEKAIRKIELYEKNGIFLGKNLLLSYETEKHPINSKAIDNLIKEFLL